MAVTGASGRFEQRPAPVTAPGRDRTLLATLLAVVGCAWAALSGPVAPAVFVLLLAALLGRWVPRLARRA